jgi:hypothetical protein
MSEDDFQLLLDTPKLWKKKIVAGSPAKPEAQDIDSADMPGAFRMATRRALLLCSKYPRSILLRLP